MKEYKIPTITGEETGWRRNLALYRCYRLAEGGNAIRKKFSDTVIWSNIAKTIDSVENLCSLYSHDLALVYAQFEMIEPFCDVPREQWNMVTALGKYGIKDLSKTDIDFSTLKGVGPKYAEILDYARKAANKPDEDEKMVGMCIKIPLNVKNWYEKEAKRCGKTSGQVMAAEILIAWRNGVTF